MTAEEAIAKVEASYQGKPTKLAQLMTRRLKEGDLTLESYCKIMEVDNARN